MRKILYLTIMLVFGIVFTSCSKGGNGDNEVEPEPKGVKFKLDNFDLTGVWESTTYPTRIISFSDDNLFSGILDDNTIDDGDYSIVGDTILIKNTYHGYNIRLELISARNGTIFFNMSYLSSSEYGNMSEKKVSVEFKKRDDEACSRHNRLIGKNIEVNTSHNNVVWNWYLSVVQHNFMTFDAELNHNNIKYKGTVHYFYLPPYLYFTIYEGGDMWSNSVFSPINKRLVEIDSNGKISIKKEK